MAHLQLFFSFLLSDSQVQVLGVPAALGLQVFLELLHDSIMLSLQSLEGH